MKIVADENIPFVHELFGLYGSVTALPGRNLTAADVNDADILVVRSVTKVNRHLLSSSRLQFVGTCTIGTDHLDTDFLQGQNIRYCSAPGCNANSVVQYVLAALAECDFLQNNKTVGIVGCGNVGSRLYKCLKALGFHCLVYDPFLSAQTQPDLCEWQQLYDCDILCLHAPLTTSGSFPTYHMFSRQQLNNLKPDCFFLNAGRGGVVDNEALLQCLTSRPNMTAVLDVWENEPDIHRQLFKKLRLATPHIAGYSHEGKTNGALMIFQALGTFLQFDKAAMAEVYNRVVATAFGSATPLSASGIDELILKTYQPKEDFQRMSDKLAQLPAAFDSLRKNYPKRREFSHYRVSGLRDLNSLAAAKQLGFVVA